MCRLIRVFSKLPRAAVLGIGLAPACAGITAGEDEGGSSDGTDEGGPATRVSWAFNRLPMLGPAFEYEGWIVVDGEPLSTGRFSVDVEGMLSLDSYEFGEGERDATAFVLSIEPQIDDDPGPSATVLLAGDIIDGAASLTIDHPAALGDDMSGAAGHYILDTPTTASDDTDAVQGIWWVDLAGGAASSLDLPALPTGWTYEGWVVTDEGPRSTGTFVNPGAPDSDIAGPAAGPDAPYPFPGQDFVDPALVLLGSSALISIEPVPDDDPNPFPLTPLTDPEVEDIASDVAQEMTNTSTYFPISGLATLD